MHLGGRIYARRLTRRDGWMFDHSYFVAPWGNDANEGSYSNPWLTLQFAADTAVAGWRTFLRGGSYSMTNCDFDTNSGTATAPIIFQSFPGELAALATTGASKVAGLRILGKDYIQILGMKVTNSGATAQGNVVRVECANNCLIAHNELIAAGTAGTNSLVAVNSLFSGADARTTSNNVIKANIVTGAVAGEGIYVKTFHAASGAVDGNVVEGNVIHDVAWEGIQHTYQTDPPAPPNTIIRRNVMYGVLGDVGAMQIALNSTIIEENFVTLTPPATGGRNGVIYTMEGIGTSYIRNNLVHDVAYDYAGAAQGGIRLQHLSADAASIVNIIHNTVYKVTNADVTKKAYGLYVSDTVAGTVNVKNNILSECENQCYNCSAAGLDMDYNCLYGTTEKTGTNEETGDPAFVDAANGDFRLSAGSPAGVLASGVGGLCALDISRAIRDGAGPSMGCYEY